MHHYPYTHKMGGIFCLLLVSLMTVGFRLCTSNNWRVANQDSFSDGPTIFSLSFADSKHGWALTPAQFSETTDGGKSWNPKLKFENADRSFYSFTLISPATGVIVGTERKNKRYAPMILRTENGGKSWEEGSINVTPQPNAKEASRLHSVSFCNSEVGWATGNDLILRTADGGRTWQTQRSGHSEQLLFGIACVSPERAWAVGQNGFVLYTDDAGKHWRRQDVGTNDTLLRVRFFDNTGWIVGGQAGRGTLLRTSDGTNWEQLPLENSNVLFDIYMKDQAGWIVGAAGTIWKTNDRGQTWVKESSPTDSDLVSLFFLTPQHGWIGGSKHTVLKLSE